MEIRIDSLKERPRKLVIEEPVESFPELCELAAQEKVTFRGKVNAELTAVLVGALVEVEGSLSCSMALPCSRCLCPVEQRLEVPVALTFSRLETRAADAGEEHELTEDEVGLITFEGESIDLRLQLEQELIMALPQHPLCRDDCAGLCPVCGAELNGDGCGCAPPVFHAGLAALRNFKAARN